MGRGTRRDRDAPRTHPRRHRQADLSSRQHRAARLAVAHTAPGCGGRRHGAGARLPRRVRQGRQAPQRCRGHRRAQHRSQSHAPLGRHARGGVRRTAAPRSQGSDRQDGRAQAARHPAGDVQRREPRHSRRRWARGRTRDGAAREEARGREPPEHVPRGQVPGLPLGHGGGSRRLHGLPGLRGRLLGREQRAGSGQAAGRVRPHPAVDTHRAVGEGRGQQGQRLPADVLPALRGRAVRAGLPRVRRLPHEGRAQRAGLQPLRRHPLLRQQLPVPRPPLQLVQLHLGGPARSPAEPRRDRAPAGRHGEVHDVHPAHREGQGRGARGGAEGQGRRRADRLPADLPDPGHHVRRSQGRRG